MSLSELTSFQKQLLNRMCQAGGGRAGQALASMLGQHRVQVDLFDAGIQSFDEATANLAAREQVVVVSFEVTGSLPGRLSLLLAEPSAMLLVAELLTGGSGEISTEVLAAEADGVLAEVGNIVASAFLNTVADVLEQACLPSPPRLHRGSNQSIMKEMSGDVGETALAIAIEAQIRASDRQVRGQIVFVPDPSRLDVLIGAS